MQPEAQLKFRHVRQMIELDIYTHPIAVPSFCAPRCNDLAFGLECISPPSFPDPERDQVFIGKTNGNSCRHNQARGPCPVQCHAGGYLRSTRSHARSCCQQCRTRRPTNSPCHLFSPAHTLSQQQPCSGPSILPPHLLRMPRDSAASSLPWS